MNKSNKSTLLAPPKYQYPTEEKNDCSVLALQWAASRTYEESHKLHRKHGRKDCSGTQFSTLAKVYDEAGFTLHEIHGSTKPAAYLKQLGMLYSQRRETEISNKDDAALGSVFSKFSAATMTNGCTLLAFCRNNPKGNFIVLTAGHAVPVIDAEIKDKVDSIRKRVICSFIFNKES